MKVDAGTRLGPYEIVAPIGAGGMGEVWRARDTRLDRSVAIKILPTEFARDAQLRLRFEREARTISQLTHPHICTLHDVGNDGGVEYLVMELLDGESLADRVSRGPLPVADVIRFGSEIAAALDVAHKRGVVHRDLKPGNIMLTRSGAKLLDFGLARNDEPAVQFGQDEPTQQRPLTREGTILGTFQYMAPEQLEGLRADQRADIFALGAVLYEMATGRRAFDGASRTSIIAAIVAGTPPPISELQPAAPVALDAIVLRCLQKDPDDRWQSAADVRHALRLLTTLAPQTAAAPKRKWLLPAVAVLALIVGALASWLAATRMLARDERTVRASLIAPPGEEFAALDRGLTISPDAKWVTFTVGVDRRLWVRRIDSGEARPLAGTEGALMPFWSPNSREIAFFNGSKLARVAIDGASPVTICDAGPRARPGAWSPSGDIVFAGDSMSGLLRVSAAGGAPSPLTKLDASLHQTTHRFATFLPDGRHFLFLAGNHEATADSNAHAIYAASIDDASKPQMIVRARSNVAYADGHLFYAVGDTLMAQPFDAKRLAVRGEPFAVVHGVDTQVASFSATFAVASDGTVVYQSAPDVAKRQLVLLGPHGLSDATNLGAPAPLRTVRFSPDGTRAAEEMLDKSSGTTDVYVEDLRTHERTRLTSTPDLSESTPIWSPDGKSIAFVRSKPFGGQASSIHLIATDGSDDRELVPATTYHQAIASWSPDGKQIYGSAWGADAQALDMETIARWDTVTGARTTLVRGIEPRIAPDGQWFQYTVKSNDGDSVWVAKVDGTHRQKVSRGSAFGLTWAANRIFYATPTEIRIVTVTEGAESVALGEETTYPRGDMSYMETLDGTNIYMVVQKSDAADRAITLLTNFRAAATDARAR